MEDDRANIEGYRNYPRIVGETGGKDFIVAHPSAMREAVHGDRARLVRVPGPEVLGGLARLRAVEPLAERCASGSRDEVRSIKMGDVSDFGNFMGAVIDAKAFAGHREAIEEARPARTPRSSSAAASTTRKGSSSSRP